DVEALEHLEPLRTPELRAGVDGGLEADPTSRLTIGRFRPLLRHALTSGNPRRRPASAAAGPGVPHHPLPAARGEALLADRYARVRQGHGTRSKRRKLGLGAEPELSERAFRAIWRTGHSGDSRPSTGSARTHATAFTQTDGSLDGTRKESAVIWLKYCDALGVLRRDCPSRPSPTSRAGGFGARCSHSNGDSLTSKPAWRGSVQVRPTTPRAPHTQWRLSY